MSFDALRWALKQNCESPMNRLVLLAVADHADAKGFCFPSQSTLAKECYCSDRAVRSALQSLGKLGLLTRTRRWRKDGYRSTDAIQLPVHLLPEQSSVRPATLPEPDADLTGTTFRASILNQSLNLKEGKLVWKYQQADGPTLNRYRDDKLWRMGEKLLGMKVPSYCDNVPFPSHIVATAKAELEKVKEHPRG